MCAEDRPRNEGSKRYSKDGFDCQIQGNLLSHYLLTQLLMPALTAGSETSGTGRIVNCTSGGLKMLRADINRELFEQMVVQDGDKRPYSLHDLRLKQSKKAAIVLTLGLRVRHSPPNPAAGVGVILDWCSIIDWCSILLCCCSNVFAGVPAAAALLLPLL